MSAELEFRQRPDIRNVDRLPYECKVCPNKARFNYCSPVCKKFKTAKARIAAVELDKQSYDAITYRIHYRHRHKRW